MEQEHFVPEGVGVMLGCLVYAERELNYPVSPTQPHSENSPKVLARTELYLESISTHFYFYLDGGNRPFFCQEGGRGC